MKKGDQARAKVMDTITNAFGADFVAIQDKKAYVWANDGPGGERLQFAISITMPKNPIERGSASSSGDAPWENAPVSTSSAPVATQLSEEDQAKVEELMRKLHLS